MAYKKERQLNYELLRIIAMLMIVCLHYLVEGGLLGNPARAGMTAAGYMAWGIEALCLVSVNVYVLISGYFGVGAPLGQADITGVTLRDALKKPMKIWGQVFFYSAAIGFGAIAFGVQEFDIYRVFTYVFPVVTEHYWFATAYVILCLLMPFLNAGFYRLGQNHIKYLLAGFLLIFCVSKTFIPMRLPTDRYGYDCIWFIALYITGAYIKRYGIKQLNPRWKALALYFGSTAGIFLSFLVIRMIYIKTGSLDKMINYGYAYNYLFCYTGAVGLFLAFKKCHKDEKHIVLLERARKPIELFSGATFGVYLIHEHINIRGAWQWLFNGGGRADISAGGFLLRMAAGVLCVYLVCTFIEIMRQRHSFTLVPALILLAYPLRHAGMGLDLMDAGYSLGNYRFFGKVDEMWGLATYLSNITGAALSRLPFGSRWVGMNVYCGLLIGAAAACVYLFMWKHYGQGRKKYCALIFAAEMLALSLCWSPVVTLYHYLGYLLMTAAVVILFEAVTKNKRRYYIAAGVILGLCVAVRMPNVTYAALILPVWCDCFWKRQAFADKAGKDGAWVIEMAKRALLCACGYASGVILMFVPICIKYGAAAYPRMVKSLFGVTGHAAGYKPSSMVMAMFGDYARYSLWLLLFLAYMAAGIAYFQIGGRLIRNVKAVDKKKVTDVSKIAYCMGPFVLLRLCYGRGMFGVDYTSYFSVYKWATVYLIVVIAMCIWFLLNKGVRKDFRLWAVFMLVIIFVTPLGSNNGLYPVINNLFLVAPLSIMMMAELFRQSKKSVGGFAFRIVMGFILLCTAVQGGLFGIGFVFHDAGAQAGGRLELMCGGAGAGLLATDKKKAEISELDEYLYMNGLNKKQVILYGDIPALAYLFDMEPAISSTWPDLDSYGLDKLQAQLDNLPAGEAGLPVIIFGRESAERLGGAADKGSLSYKKLAAIREFMEKNGYEERFRNGGYIVVAEKGE